MGTTRAKKSGLSDTRRSGTGIALTDADRAVANAAEAWFAATAECQREMVGFVSMRLGKDIEAAHEMMACKDLANVAAIQSRWIEEILRDYNTEMSKLMTIYTKSVNDGLDPKGRRF